jgi:hypothetical protein
LILNPSKWWIYPNTQFVGTGQQKSRVAQGENIKVHCAYEQNNPDATKSRDMKGEKETAKSFSTGGEPVRCRGN